MSKWAREELVEMMAARAPGSRRKPLDAYYTPDEVAWKIVSRLPGGFRRIWEPHVGGGAFLRALKRRYMVGQEEWPMIVGTDIDPYAEGFHEHNVAMMQQDALTHKGRYDLIIGNPPYSRAEEHVRHFLSLEPAMCVMLLRLGFLASQRRAAFWEEFPLAGLWVLSKRPSFTGGGTDSSDYAAFVWRGMEKFRLQGEPHEYTWNAQQEISWL